MIFYAVHITGERYGVYFQKYTDALRYYDKQDHYTHLWTITTCHASTYSFYPVADREGQCTIGNTVVGNVPDNYNYMDEN